MNSWIPLISALIGGSVTLLVTVITQRVQEQKSKDELRFERQKFREELRKEKRLRINEVHKLREQKKIDTNLIQKNKVVEEQISLLENLSNSLWELQFLSLAVSYYKVHDDQKRFELAVKDYKEKSWKLFKEIRCEISKANRLTTRKQYNNLLTFFDKNFIHQVDEKLMNLIKNDTSIKDWKDHYHETLYIFSKEIDNIITSLAEELDLTSPKSSR